MINAKDGAFVYGFGGKNASACIRDTRGGNTKMLYSLEGERSVR